MLHVDGHVLPDRESEIAGDGECRPFYVFDDERQDWIAGPFRWRWLARLWILRHGSASQSTA